MLPGGKCHEIWVSWCWCGLWPACTESREGVTSVWVDGCCAYCSWSLLQIQMAKVGSRRLHATVGCSVHRRRICRVCQYLRCVLVLVPKHVHMGSQVAILKHNLKFKQTIDITQDGTGIRQAAKGVTAILFSGQDTQAYVQMSKGVVR